MLTAEQIDVVLNQYRDDMRGKERTLTDEEKALNEQLKNSPEFKKLLSTCIMASALGGPPVIGASIFLSMYLGYLMGKTDVETRELARLVQ